MTQGPAAIPSARTRPAAQAVDPDALPFLWHRRPYDPSGAGNDDEVFRLPELVVTPDESYWQFPDDQQSSLRDFRRILAALTAPDAPASHRTTDSPGAAPGAVRTAGVRLDDSTPLNIDDNGIVAAIDRQTQVLAGMREEMRRRQRGTALFDAPTLA